MELHNLRAIEESVTVISVLLQPSTGSAFERQRTKNVRRGFDGIIYMMKGTYLNGNKVLPSS